MTSDPTRQGEVTSAVADGVATVTFGHPKSNSLPGAVLSRLADAIKGAGADSAVRVIVLRSTGTGAFCAGASFDELLAVKDPSGGQQFFSGFANVILAMIRAPQFVVARVHGKAAGGGVGLIAAADYALATDGAAVKLSELAVGIGPFVVGPVIERKVGAGAFAAMSVDADWRSAAWAATHGLYAETLESVEALDQRLESRVATLARANPAAVRDLKRVFWEGTDAWDELLRRRAAVSGRLVLSEEAQAAIARAGKR
ncbi:MAG: enoyl-CoA hydratase/isomerase family protein [Gemmatimonadales bacterium]